jgi:uncharacterized membrane protein
MARFCTNCGSAMDDTAAFCPSCGKAAPGSVSGGSTTPVAGGLTDNVAGALAYITIIPAIVFLLIEPYNRNRFVRFHAFQSIFVWIGIAIIHWLFTILWFLFFIWGIIDIAIFVLLLVLVLKAYQGQKWKLPVLGDLAEKQAGV